MGVTLTHEEALAFLESAHTGILTTLRRDGWPISLPVWFALVDGVVHVRTPRHTKKVARVAPTRASPSWPRAVCTGRSSRLSS